MKCLPVFLLLLQISPDLPASQALSAPAPGSSAEMTTPTTDAAPSTTASLEAFVRPRVTTVPLQLSQLEAPQATAAQRHETLERWKRTLSEAFTTSPLAADPEVRDLYHNALYVATILPADDLSRYGVRRALRAYTELDDEELQRMALESAYGVDPQAFIAEVAVIAEVTTTPKHFAMAALYLARALPDGASARRQLLEQLKTKFPDWGANPILLMLERDLHRHGPAEGRAAQPQPPLTDILSHRFAPGYPVVYSLQRPDRSQPGLAVVRAPDGRFVRRPDGTLFSVTHLARSRSDLPGYLTNGNTPQGLFSIRGVNRTRSRAIGQTPFLHIFMPHEISPGLWLHDPALAEGTSWTLEMYRNLLPVGSGSGWRDYDPIYTAWYAGAAGRFDILSHGTTVDPSFYVGQAWYPGTPTSGCLCARELWDPSTGRALVSDQLALVHAYLEAAGVEVPRSGVEGEIRLPRGEPEGFLAVVEVGEKSQPVTLDEVLMALLEAETLAAQQ